jgi:hypothetical protein
MASDQDSVLMQDFKVIEKKFSGLPSFSLAEIRKLFPETNPKTIGWKIYKMAERGLLRRESHGYYSLRTEEKKISTGFDYLSTQAKKIYTIMQNYGYAFYVSGIDILSGDLLHLPERFPVIIVMEASGFNEIQEELIRSEFTVMTVKDYQSNFDRQFVSNFDVILMRGRNFQLASNGIAVKEKAFLDLYYAVTRMNYVYSIEELNRTFDTLTRKEAISPFRIRAAAVDLSIGTEVEFMMKIPRLPPKSRAFIEKRLEAVENEVQSEGFADQ